MDQPDCRRDLKKEAQLRADKKVMEMLYELEDTSQAEKLFAGWNETLIFSCLQKVMGKIYVTDLEQQ